MTRRRKVLLATTLLLSASAGLGGLVYVAWLRDEPPPADQDLRCFRRVVAADENGFVAWDLPEPIVVWPDDEEHVHWQSDTFDVEAAREVLEKNATALAKLDESLDRADFQVPESTSPAALVPYLLDWHSVSHVALCRARLLFETGREPEAFDGALKLLRFGHCIEGSQGAVIHFVVGCAIKIKALENLIQLLTWSRLEPEVLLPYAGRIARYRPTREALRDAFRVEYVTLSHGFGLLAQGRREGWESLDLGRGGWAGWLLRAPIFKANETRRLLAEQLRLMIDEVDKPAAMRRPLRDFRGELGEMSIRWLFTNGSGKVVLGLLVPSFELSIVQRDNEDFAISVVQTLIALRCFQRENGDLPDFLQELVPDLLPEVPRDPFTRAPLRYSREKRLIYSLGLDGEDAGGSSEKDPKKARRDLEEPTFRIEF